MYKNHYEMWQNFFIAMSKMTKKTTADYLTPYWLLWRWLFSECIRKKGFGPGET